MCWIVSSRENFTCIPISNKTFKSYSIGYFLTLSHTFDHSHTHTRTHRTQKYTCMRRFPFGYCFSLLVIFCCCWCCCRSNSRTFACICVHWNCFVHVVAELRLPYKNAQSSKTKQKPFQSHTSFSETFRNATVAVTDTDSMYCRLRSYKKYNVS